MLLCSFWNWKINSKSVNTVSDLQIPSFDVQNTSTKNVASPTTRTSEKKLVAKQNDINVNFKILTENFSLFVPESSSVLQALIIAQGQQLTTFSGKEYPALGFFVSDIGDLHSGDGDYLIYYINGKEASVGVSSYELRDGDTIEWKLE